MFEYPFAALVTLLSLFVFFWMATRIGKARGEFEIKAPAQEGPDAFNRVIRTYANTHEMLVLFLPALWLFALTVSDMWAGIIGVFFPIGRIIFALGYYRAAEDRTRGFMIGFIATVLLLIGASVGTLHVLVATYG